MTHRNSRKACSHIPGQEKATAAELEASEAGLCPAVKDDRHIVATICDPNWIRGSPRSGNTINKQKPLTPCRKSCGSIRHFMKVEQRRATTVSWREAIPPGKGEADLNPIQLRAALPSSNAQPSEVPNYICSGTASIESWYRNGEGHAKVTSF